MAKNRDDFASKTCGLKKCRWTMTTTRKLRTIYAPHTTHLFIYVGCSLKHRRMICVNQAFYLDM